MKNSFEGVSRRDLLRYTGILGAATAITAGLGACGDGDGDSGTTSGADSGPAGKTIEATLAFTLSSAFDPMNASSAVATAVNQHVFEALIDLDPITREPYLALAGAQPTPSADGLTWTVTLREGAKFSDGTPVTAEDVAWSFQRAMDPANKALMAGFITFLDKVTAKDPRTAEFTLKHPFSLFPQRIAVIKIVPKAKTGDAAASKAFDTAPIGSGPFTVVSANATAGVVMGINAAYNGSRPAKVEKITLRTSSDGTARLNDLRGGSSQAIEAVPYLDVKALSGGDRKVEEKQAFNHMFLMFNCTAAPFSDKRVRQALHYAIDKDKVIKTALQGYGTAATSYLDAGNAGYQQAGTVYNYDPDKAKSLLAAAGASNLSFELHTTDAAFIKDSAPIVIDAWKAIGVNATLNTMPSSAIYGTVVPGPNFRVLAASGDPTTFGPDVDLLLRWFYLNQTWTKDRHRWTNDQAKQCAQLIESAAKASGAEQKAIWKQALDIIAEEVPLYPVFHVKMVTAHDPKKLKNFQGASTTGLYFLNTSRA